MSPYISVMIEENDGMKVSEVYEAVQNYLSVRSSSATKRLKLKKPKNNKEFTFSMDRNEQIADAYEGINVWWVFHSRESKQTVLFSWDTNTEEKRYYELTFNKKHKQKIFDEYLPYVMEEVKTLDIRSRYRKIHTNKSDSKDYEFRNRVWTPVMFDHPSTFETLALEPEVKQEIVEDLKRFMRGEKYYKQVGRVWKRGYLLYGPPGTGKSNLIAAMANFLDERLFIFTTNHIERLDPTVLRSGRMDKHIHLSFCTFGAFKILASNYLSIANHDLYPDIQYVMEVAQITPADVAEHLMKMVDHPTTALESLIEALREAKERAASATLKGMSKVNASGTDGQV
eukprot:PITA_20491